MSTAWELAKLSEVCTKISDGTHHSPEVQHSEPGKGRFKYITSKNIRPWGLDLGDIAYVDEKVHREIYSRCQPELGDVLLTKDGANTGNVAINTLDEEFSLLSSVALLKPMRDVLESRFLRYYIESPVGSKRLLGEMTGTAIRRIILIKIKDTEIPVAPIAEQRRIVAEIEKQFTRLEAGVAALRRVQANLKRYRAAVLKAACEGKLVPTEAELCKVAAASRRSSGNKQSRDGSATFETGAQLLARILTERRMNWTGRGKYKEPAVPDIAKLQPLPEGWTWATIGACFPVCVGATPSRKEPSYWGGDIPWVSSGEVRFKPIVDTRETITRKGLENSSTQLNPEGTVLLGMIGEGKTRGQTAILKLAACNNQNSAAIWASQTPVPPEFVYFWLWSQYDNTRRTSSGNNQPALNKARVEAMPIPLPPLAEQTRIVAEVERRLSVVEELESVVSADLQRASRLRQSMLQKAFTGELV